MLKSNMPHVPYAAARVISAKVGPEFHKELREFAAKNDCAVAAVVKTAIEHYLQANAQ